MLLSNHHRMATVIAPIGTSVDRVALHSGPQAEPLWTRSAAAAPSSCTLTAT